MGKGNTIIILEHNIIYKQKGIYASFPKLLYTDVNNIEVKFYTSHFVDHCGISNMRVMTSPNLGKTWETILNVKKNDVYVPRQDMDSYCIDGKYIGAKSWSIIPKGFEKFNKNKLYYKHPNKKDIILARRNLFIKVMPELYKEELIALPGMKAIFAFPRHIEFNGIILMSMYAITKDNRSKNFIYRSSKINGGDWELISMFPSNVIEGDEMALLHLGGSKVMALIRNDVDKYMMQSFSKDAGRTWTYPILTDIKGSPPHLLRLKNGNILCTYGYRYEPMGIRARVSKDEGQTWEKEIILRDDGGTLGELHKTKWFRKKHSGMWDLGYPVSIQFDFDDESILTVYYFTGHDGITHIASTKWMIK